MILEIHMIQNFAPSNLNRSDTGSPKDCIFGGVRRARISSQCFKRAMRTYFRETFEKSENLAERTTILVDNISEKLIALGKEESQARRVVENLIGGVGLAMSTKHQEQTEYLLFLGRTEIQRFLDICIEYYTVLSEINLENEESSSRKEKKKGKKGAVPPEVTKKVLEAMDGGKAADLGLFGRMLADLAVKSRDAASQVAHAISTHKVGLEFDFFTAIDDLKPTDKPGSDHLGTVEFNSACFYRYANVDVDKLRENLQGDEELTKATVSAYIKAAVEALPTGKQNTFATHERPSLVYAVVRDSGMLSLANAFENPVQHKEWNGGGYDEGLVSNSIRHLADHYGKVTGVYGDSATSRLFIQTENASADKLGDQVATFAELLDGTMTAIFNSQEA